MLIVIGKTYSIETNKTRALLDLENRPYRYIDLEDDPDKAYWLGWVKSNKILSIPVVLLQETHCFVVGHDPEALKKLLEPSAPPPPQSQ